MNRISSILFIEILYKHISIFLGFMKLEHNFTIRNDLFMNFFLYISFIYILILYIIKYITTKYDKNLLIKLKVKKYNISHMLIDSVNLYNNRVTYLNSKYYNVKKCKRTKKAVVVLLTYNEINTFINRNFNFLKHKYYDKLIFFVTENVTSTENFRNISYNVINISEIFFKFPYMFNESYFTPLFQKRGKWNYQHMCRFFFRDIFLLPSMCAIDMFMRLDSDSILNTSTNIFNYMRKESVYMYNRVFNDAKRVIKNLKSFTQSYVNEFNVKIKDKKSYKLLFKKTVLSYYNNFEICRIEFFRSKEIIQFTNLIDLSYGQFIYRWGDAPLRFICLSLFCNSQYKIPLPNNINYVHNYKK